MGTGPYAWWLLSLNFGHEMFKRRKGANIGNISNQEDQKLALKHKGKYNRILELFV